MGGALRQKTKMEPPGSGHPALEKEEGEYFSAALG